MTGKAPERLGNSDPSMAPHGCYRCQGEDHWVTIVVRTDEEWGRLVRVMGSPEWAGDVRYRRLSGRLEGKAELDRQIGEWTRQRQPYEVMHILQEAGVPAGAVLSNAEILNDPHFQARGFFHTIGHPEAGTHLYPGMPWRMSGIPEAPRRPAPSFAQHNEYVFGDLLGLTKEELTALEVEEAIGREPLI